MDVCVCRRAQLNAVVSAAVHACNAEDGIARTRVIFNDYLVRGEDNGQGEEVRG